MEQTSWLLSKNGDTPLELYEEFKKSETRKERRWKILSLISAGGFVASMLMIFFALSLPKTVPLVISVNEFGEQKYLGDVSKYSYNDIKVPKECYEYQLRKFITNTYTLPSDFTVLKTNLKENYSLLTSSSANKFNILLDELNPRKDFGKSLASVEFVSILSQSKNTYQVDYIVTRTQNNGNVKTKTRMRALISVELMVPNKQDIEVNPLGIYITNFDFVEIGGYYE